MLETFTINYIIPNQLQKDSSIKWHWIFRGGSIYKMIKMSCVENLVWFCSNHMVFRQNLSPLFRERIFSFARMNLTKTSFASFRGGPCHLTMKESQPFIKGLTLNTWDLIHLPDPKVAVCERRAWFRYLSFREAFATLSRISGDIWWGEQRVGVQIWRCIYTT